MWLKYRHKYSSGRGDWEYLEIGSDDKDTVEETLHELHQECDDGGEHYRGTDHEVIDVPPLEVLNAEIMRHDQSARWHAGKLTQLFRLRYSEYGSSELIPDEGK